MQHSKGLRLDDKILAFLAPLAGGALFAAISLGLDLAANKKPDFLDPTYIFETAVVSAAGALLSAALFGARFIMLAAKFAERNYLSIPWTTDSKYKQVQEAKIDITHAIFDLFEMVDTKLDSAAAQEIAVRAVHIILEEQKQNLDHHGRLIFTSPQPQYLASLKHNSVAAASLGSDGYGLVFSRAKEGDVIHATDFQNSAYWWLDPKIAFSFFELNLEAIKRGATVVRVFGRHHHKWKEDEAGAKQALIELQAKIEGIDVYTIDYADFSEDMGFDIQAIDHLVLLRNGQPLPGIEWKIDKKGDTENVFFVLSDLRLNKIETNFNKLLSSAGRGSSLKQIELEEAYNPKHPDDYAKIRSEFNRIATSMIRGS